MAGIFYEYECPKGHKQTEMRRLKDRDALARCNECQEVMDRVLFHPVKTTFKFHDKSSYK